MKTKASKYFVRYFIVLAVLGSLATIAVGQQAGALGDTFFDNSDVSRHPGASGSPSVELAVGQTNYVRKTAAKLKVYFTSSSGSVRFERYKYCPSGADEGPGSAKDTVFTVSSSTGKVRVNGKGAWESEQSVTGGYTTGGGCNDSLTFDLRNLTKDKSGMFSAKIDVDNDSGDYMNFFRIVSPTKGAVIAHAEGKAGWDVTIDQRGESPKWSDYKIKFGSDCDVKSAGKRAIRLYDLDGPGGSGAQVGRITLRLRARDMAGGSWSYVDISNTENRGYAQSINPVQQSNADQLVWFTARPNYQYEFELNNVYYNNTIQYGAPFDGIYYLTGCQDWKARSETFVRGGGRSGWGSAGRTVTAAPGKTVYFRHDVINDGPGVASTKGRVQRNWNGSGDVSGWRDWDDLRGSNNLKSGQRHTPIKDISFKIPDDAAAGTLYCQRYFIDPSKNNKGDLSGGFTGNQACVQVSSNPLPGPYELDAYISSVPSTYSYYPSIKVTGSVGAVNGTVSGDHAWEIYAVRYHGDPDRKIEGLSADPDACSQVSSDDRFDDGCELVDSATYPTTSSKSPTYSKGGPDPAGTYLCFFTRVQNPTDESADDASWKYSDEMQCSIAGTKPKVQVWGGNLSVGKSFDGVLNEDASVEGLISAVKGNSLGSWIEYSTLAPGRVSGVASGAGLAGTEGSPSSVLSGLSRLTYANTNFDAGESYGYYDTQDSSLPDPSGLAEKYNLTVGTVASGEYDVQTLRAGVNRVVRLDDSGGLTIAGSDNTLSKGEWLVIDAPDRDVVIADDISYANEGMASTSDLPQLVIRAKSITINDNVANVDAWLVAGDTIKTCQKTDRLTIDDCDRLLRVNGPVISRSLILARTAGEDNDPAEVLNLRPDAYLWMYNLANSHTDYRVDYVRELPPRY